MNGSRIVEKNQKDFFSANQEVIRERTTGTTLLLLELPPLPFSLFNKKHRKNGT